MCSDRTNSVLNSQEKEDLGIFSWDKLLDELEVNAPVFLSILHMCTQTKKPRINQDAVVGICTAILLKYRFPKMSLDQKILSIILYAGQSGKLVRLLSSYNS